MEVKKCVERVFCNENVNAILLFLVGMAFITVIARMADSFMVPQVVVGASQEMRLQYPMEIEGQIRAKGKRAVYCMENLRVAQVMVEKGDRVEKGDLLFTVDKDGLQEQIQQIGQEIQKGGLQMEDLERAYDKQAAQQAQEYRRAKEDYQEAERAAENAVNAAYQEMEKARQELSQHDGVRPVEDFGGMGERILGSGEIERGEVKGYNIGGQENRLEMKGNEAGEGGTEVDEAGEGGTEVDGETGVNGVGKAGTGVDEAGEGGTEVDGEKEAGEVQDHERIEDTGLESSLAVWVQKREELAQQYAEKQKLYEDAVASKDVSLKNAARQLEDCSQEISRDNAQALLQMEQEKLFDTLQELEEIDKADGKICASLDGKVFECVLSTGSITTTEPALILEDLSQPLQFEGMISQSDCPWVEEGIECSLKAKGGLAPIEGLKISKVAEDEEGQGAYRVVAEVHSDSAIQTGEATLSFTQESGRYSDCIPVSSLHTGDAGNYIFGIKEDITILGIQSVAERIPVTPIEENGEYVAVKEDLSAYSAIIINASKSIKEGDRVRIAEE